MKESQYINVFKNDNMTLSKHKDKEEFWLYDYTRGMNLSMKAKTEQQAFVEALTYYQKRLKEVEQELKTLNNKVDSFIGSVSEDED